MTPETHAKGFEQIVALEREQQERVEREQASMAQERQMTQRRYADEEHNEKERAHTEARAVLTAFRDDVSVIVKRGEAEEKADEDALERAYAQRAPALAHTLTDRMFDPSFLSAA